MKKINEQTELEEKNPPKSLHRQRKKRRKSSLPIIAETSPLILTEDRMSGHRGRVNPDAPPPKQGVNPPIPLFHVRGTDPTSSPSLKSDTSKHQHYTIFT